MKNIVSYLFLLLVVSGYSQSDNTDIIVERIMKEQKIVGLSLAAIKNGKTTVNRGYGLANAEHNMPLTPASVIRLYL